MADELDKHGKRTEDKDVELHKFKKRDEDVQADEEPDVELHKYSHRPKR